MTWSDYKDPKGFHIFDTETRELERITNPRRIHKKLIYNDKKEDYYKKDLTEFEDTFVKIFVSNKTDENMFNDLIDRFQNKMNVHEVNVVEDIQSDMAASVKEDILDQGEDTITFLNNYVDQIQTDLDKDKLKEFIKETYVEANDHYSG